MINFEDKRVLVIAPHQDDESLGCGGLIQKLNPENIRVVFGTVLGDSAIYKKFNTRTGEYEEYKGITRKRETIRALQVLTGRVHTIHTLAESKKHHSLETIPRKDLVRVIERHIAEFKPDIVVIPPISYDQDHKAVYEASVTATRPHYFTGTVLKYEIGVDKEDFTPTLYITLTEEEVDIKLKAFGQYKTQSIGKQLVSKEGILAKATLSGLSIGEDFAERYEVVRMKTKVPKKDKLERGND